MAAENRFAPVPLPPWSGDRRDAAAFAEAALGWALSAPVLALAAESGWPAPHGSPGERLRQLVTRSTDWDFRGTNERNFIAAGEARIGGRALDRDLVLEAVDALGLVHRSPPPDAATDLVVLSGLVRACVNRTRYAATLLQRDLAPHRTVVLTAHRPLGRDEPEQARALGLGDVADERAAAVEAARVAFGLAEADHVEEGTSADGGGHARWASYEWSRGGGSTVQVLCAPSSDPAQRRANTHDQLSFWSARHDVGPAHDVLLVTTQIYVPYQYFEAVRALGFARGCGVAVAGVDAAASYAPTRTFEPPDYLQEVRSALASVLALQRDD